MPMKSAVLASLLFHELGFQEGQRSNGLNNRHRRTQSLRVPNITQHEMASRHSEQNEVCIFKAKGQDISKPRLAHFQSLIGHSSILERPSKRDPAVRESPCVGTSVRLKYKAPRRDTPKSETPNLWPWLGSRIFA